MKHSLRRQLIAIVVLVIVLSLVTIGVFDGLLLGRVYQRAKVGRLHNAYEFLRTNTDAYDSNSFETRLAGIATIDNLQFFIADSELHTAYISYGDPQILSARLFGYYTGIYRGEIEIVEEAERYTVQKARDWNTLDYLELWGQLENGDYFLIRTPMESMKESARISNKFNIILGGLVVAAASVLLYFILRRFTKPIEELTAISQKMASLDFDTKYEVRKGRENEIDVLGQQLNTLSDELDSTITELKTANLALEKDVEEKTRIDEMRKEFINNVSHELKTPIALIQGYAEGLRDNIADDPDSRDFYCDVIVDESSKMNRLVRQLLTLNRLESGNERLELARFDLTALIRGVIGGMKLMIDECGVSVLFSQDEPVFVYGDEFGIEEVLTNYLTNALHFALYDRKIEIRLTRKEGEIITSVFNTGDPIPQDSLGKLWDKFYKADKARTREYGGSGIGLSIVKAIMDAHRKSCGVQNYENGVAFWFSLDTAEPKET